MNVYDTANKLAQELRTSEEYLSYKKIKEELNQNAEVKAKIREFEEKRYEVQLEALKWEEQEKTKLEEMQKICRTYAKRHCQKIFWNRIKIQRTTCRRKQNNRRSSARRNKINTQYPSENHWGILLLTNVRASNAHPFFEKTAEKLRKDRKNDKKMAIYRKQ